MPTRRHKSFSLTRARAAGGSLSSGDHLRAAAFAAVARLAVAAAGMTMRLRTEGESDLSRYRRLGPGGLLFAMWHGDYFPVFYHGRHSGAHVVVSRSPDGEILDRILRSYGYGTVRGSSSRGATRAMIDLARRVRAGSDAAVAVDGPKGPALRVKSGIVLLAKLTGCPIVPVAAGISRCKTFASWDRFRLPLPFARVLLAAAPPILVPAGASNTVLHEKRRQLQAALDGLARRTQQRIDQGTTRAPATMARR